MWPFKYPYTNFHELNLDWILEEITRNKNSIITLENTINNIDPDAIGNPGVLHVGSETGMYRTINEAIAFAKNYCTPTNRVLIMIHGGTYRETIRLLPNPGIDMIGLSDTTIMCPSEIQYPDGALYTVGSGFFKNITFETTGGGFYALHYEVQGFEDAAENTECIFENCRFIGHNRKGGVGCGGGCNDSLKFINCEIISEGERAGYFHNHPRFDHSKFNLECISCKIEGTYSVVIEYYPANALDMSFKNNTMSGKTLFRNMNNNYSTGYVTGSDKLGNHSSGNTGRALETERTVTASFPAAIMSNYYRVNLPVYGIINKESIAVEEFSENPLPTTLVISPYVLWVEIAYPVPENTGRTSLQAIFHIRPQLN